MSRAGSTEDRIRYLTIHHEDAMDAMRARLRNALEGELTVVLENAMVAHSKGKRDVVEYQINDALAIVAREIKRIK